MMQYTTLADLIVWTLVSFGITLCVTRGKILHPIREKILRTSTHLGQLVQCPMCFGFWVGVSLSLLWRSVSGNCILDGFYSLSINSLLYFLSWHLALKDGSV
jgi:hypothetical protein